MALQRNTQTLSVLTYTLLAMLAFAANSVLCRMALAAGVIDPTSFTTIRIFSGASMLLVILRLKEAQIQIGAADPRAAFSLFAYALCFSYAYTKLSTGTGALILFASVQITMILMGLRRGDRPGKIAWTGLMVASSGLVYLLLPGVAAPPLSSAVLMAVAGTAWGIYSFLGSSATDPLRASTANFILALPLALITSVTLFPTMYLTLNGALLAIASGALASGLGYVVWYAALPYLQPITAASVQLSVPVIAAIGGIVLLDEPFAIRLLISTVLTLGGISLVLSANNKC